MSHPSAIAPRKISRTRELLVQNIDDEARSLDAFTLLAGAPAQHSNSAAAVAIALFNDRRVKTEAIVAAASQRLAGRRPQLHTFVPLYTTNYCDSECKMCAMRVGNRKLVREFAGRRAIEEQLDILYNDEHVRGVGFLTGEYRDKFSRLASAFRIGWAMRTALDRGFRRVYFNIGSMERDEIDVLADWVSPNEPVTMCVFQETSDRTTYARFMGTGDAYPKSDFDRRYHSFDHWLDAGFRDVNLGALVGLCDDPTIEIANLLSHVSSLAAIGAVVEISMPRLRPAFAARKGSRVSDDQYLRTLAAVAFACPEQRLVLTTRESEEFQQRAIDLCGVFSPGSPDVTPYQRFAQARNDVATSQFAIADTRRPREILADLESSGRPVANFEMSSAEAAVA